MSRWKKTVEPWDGAFRAVVRNGCYATDHGDLRATRSEADQDRVRVQGLGPESWVEEYREGQWRKV